MTTRSLLSGPSTLSSATARGANALHQLQDPLRKLAFYSYIEGHRALLAEIIRITWLPSQLTLIFSPHSGGDMDSLIHASLPRKSSTVRRRRMHDWRRTVPMFVYRSSMALDYLRIKG